MSNAPARRKRAKASMAQGMPVPSMIDVSDLRALTTGNESKIGGDRRSAGNSGSYSKDFKIALVRRLCLGDYLADICSEEGMPAEKTVLEWMRDDAELAVMYETGKPHRARALLEGALDEITKITDRESAAMADRRANIRLRVAALLDPGKYSTSAHHALVANGQQGASVSVNINISDGNRRVSAPLIDITPDVQAPQPKTKTRLGKAKRR